MGKIVLFWENSFILNINLFLEIIDDFQGGVGCSEVKGGRLPQGGSSFQRGIGTPLHVITNLFVWKEDLPYFFLAGHFSRTGNPVGMTLVGHF